jgi:hypothetical protein
MFLYKFICDLFNVASNSKVTNELETMPKEAIVT